MSDGLATVQSLAVQCVPINKAGEGDRSMAGMKKIELNHSTGEIPIK